MKRIAIIGAGRLGTSLAYALSKNGFVITALSCRSRPSARQSREKIGQGLATTDHVKAASKGEMIFLTVPDDRIESIIQELAVSSLNWGEKIIFHCSGLLSSSILGPLRSKGALTASVHPCFSFPRKQDNPNLFQGVFFALEGDDLAVAEAKDIVQKIGGSHFMIRPEDKACYHTSCSMASNMSVTLFYTALSLLSTCGLTEVEAKKVLWPLLEGTLHNVNKIDAFDALTGPISRGDLTTIKKHLEELKKSPQTHRIYIELARQTLDMIKRREKISSEKISALEALLERE
jgi:predicted short-subunit dehydrogenase-like oxidoreductase (DUF2520 family)